MPNIQVLDQSTINQIAAGEVIERPASVVKELVENAIDAGASAVTVEIKEGGISFIRITDNGCGIEKDQVARAFLRHATSKISNAGDLETVASLGFRGEALSSIAAVAQVELITKTPSALTGVCYRIEGGEECSMEEIGAPEGTTILVRNLFFHTPVRKKFLKSPATEGNYIAELMEHMALSHPEVSLRFINNGQNKLYTSGNNRLKDLIYTVYGREVSANLQEISETSEELSVSGFLGKPVISRGNRTMENYFINGRYIKSRLISKAIETAYKPYMMQHRYPFVVLHFRFDFDLIDVNVHPTKMEVRFQEEERIFSLILGMLERGLRGKEYIPDVHLEETKEEKKILPKAPEPFETNRLENRQEKKVVSLPEKLIEETLKKQEESKKTTNPVSYETDGRTGKQETRIVKESGGYTPGVVLPEFQSHSSLSKRIQGTTESAFPENEPVPMSIVPEKTIPFPEKGQSETSEGKNRENQKINEPVITDAVQETLFQEPLLSEKARIQHRIIGQLFDTYWLIQYGDQLYMMDQHAAHEKVLYEKLMRAYQNREPFSQLISPSVIVTLTIQEQTVFEQYRSVFQHMGYEIEPYGGNEYAVSAVPGDLPGISPQEVLTDLFASLEDGWGDQALERIAEKTASMACKAAVKGNNRLSVKEADALISELLTLENPYACPHGRPTIIMMSKYEIEKKFKRIV